MAALFTSVSLFCCVTSLLIHTRAAFQLTFSQLQIYEPGNKTLNLCSADGLPTPSCGVYWLSIAVDVPASTQANVSLMGSPDTLGFVRTYTVAGIDTMFTSAAVEASYTGTDDFTMNSNYPNANPTADQQTYMAGFGMDTVLSPLVTFSVARRFNQTVAGQVTYDRVMLDTSGAWNALTNTFTAPNDGVYLFYYGIGGRRVAQHTVSLNVNGQQRQLLVDAPKVGATLVNDGVDTMGRVCVTKLNASDDVTVSYTGGQLYSDSFSQPTSFAGFLYNPLSGIQVAWSTSRTALETNYVAGSGPVTFQQTGINVGGAWQPAGSQAVIPVAGSYYLHLDVAACTTGYVQADVRVNGNVVFSVNYAGNGPQGHSRGNSAMVHVSVGDVVSVVARASTCVYGGPSGLTSFSGLLILPCGFLDRQQSNTFNAAFTF